MSLRPRKKYDYRESGMLPPPGGTTGYLYYARLRTAIGPVYKLGFTSMNSVHDRLAYKGDGAEKLIDEVLLFHHHHNAWDLEQELHVLCFHKKLFPSGSTANMPLLGNGQSELYGEDILRMDSGYTPELAIAAKRQAMGLPVREVAKLPQEPLPSPSPNGPVARLVIRLVELPFLVLGKFLSAALSAYVANTQSRQAELSLEEEQRLEFLIDYLNAERRLAEQALGIAQQTDDINVVRSSDAPAARERLRLANVLKDMSAKNAATYLATRGELDSALIGEFEVHWDWDRLSRSASVRWHLHLIELFEERWNWRWLSRNESLPWSSNLIARFEERWDWESLSKNTALPWSRDLIARFSQRWDWSSISGSTTLPWSHDLVANFADQWDWALLSGNAALQLNSALFEQFREKWVLEDFNGDGLAGNRSQPVSVELLEQYVDIVDWQNLSQYQTLPWSLDLVERFEDRWYWPWLSGNAALPWSIELIKRFEDRWDWEHLSANQGLPWSLELIDLFAGKWVVNGGDYGVTGFAINEALPWTPDLIRRFADRLNWGDLSANTALPWSQQLISTYEDRWDWTRLSMNLSLPWTLQLIGRFTERWDWGSHKTGLSGNEAVPWSLQLIDCFSERLDFVILSSNPTVPWSLELINRFEDKWFWLQLSRNEALPWSIDLIERFSNRWRWADWGELCDNKALALPLLDREAIIEIMGAVAQRGKNGGRFAGQSPLNPETRLGPGTR